MASKPLEASRPTFTVIEGGATQSSPWLELPSGLLVRSPKDKNSVIRLRLSKVDVQKALQANRRQPLLDCWSMVVGESPPVPNIGQYDARLAASPLVPVSKAHACFRGLKRPLGDDAHGWDVVAYISRPRWHFRYVPDMACVAKLHKVPDDLVFVTYVRLDFSAEGNRPKARNQELRSTMGVIYRWELVEVDASLPTLPADFRERYRKRMW